MNPPTLTFMTNADDQRSRKTERLGEVLRRVAARLATQRNSGSAFNGSSQDDEKGAATGGYAPAAADWTGRGGDRSSGGERIQFAAHVGVRRAAETAKGPTPSYAVSAAPLSW